jgi:hypothetical protein
MLARYTMIRGATASSLPAGVRQDTRKHTRHPLRPSAALVDAFLGRTLDDAAYEAFRVGYLAALEARFAEDRAPFDALAALARARDVHLGCSCPTARSPDVQRCHTVLALRFMRERYPDLDVRLPGA